MSCELSANTGIKSMAICRICVIECHKIVFSKKNVPGSFCRAQSEKLFFLTKNLFTIYIQMYQHTNYKKAVTNLYPNGCVILKASIEKV